MKTGKKFAVILSGCGVYDGSEIHEAVLTMLAIDKSGNSYELFAPDKLQHHVINHTNGEVMNENRNVLVESARIARGNIKNINACMPEQFDAIIFPGGFGAAKNLSTYAFDGPSCTVDSDVELLVKKAAIQNKAIGALCIAPVVIAKILGSVEVTIGTDASTAAHIESFGAKHSMTDYSGVTIDKKNKIYTTPCYMLGKSITQVAEGAENLINAMLNDLQ